LSCNKPFDSIAVDDDVDDGDLAASAGGNNDGGGFNAVHGKIRIRLNIQLPIQRQLLFGGKEDTI
jgi:hypothetical protein